MVRYDALVFDSGTTWTLEAPQALVFIVDFFYE